MERRQTHLATRLGMPAPALLASRGWVCDRIEDSVRLSASAVNATLALSHTHGDYNRRVLVFGMIIARSLKTVFVGDHH